MLKNHLLITLRRLSRKKGYAILNVVGLALGLAVCGILLLFVRHESSYEQFHEKVDRLHVLIAEAGPQHSRTSTHTHRLAYGPVITDVVPEVEKTVRVMNSGAGYMLVEDELRTLSGIRMAYVDDSVFDVFTFPLIAGDPGTALRDPRTAVVDRKSAMQLFGTDNPYEVMGRTFEHQSFLFEVTGFMEEVPATTMWRPNILLSLETYLVDPNWSYNSPYVSAFHVYILYRSENTPTDVLQKAVETLPDDFHFIENLTFRSQPIADVHLYGYDIYAARDITDVATAAASGRSLSTGEITRLRIFALVAVLILLLATVNYVNLATAYGMQRTREVGVRKSLGAARGQLFLQSLVESVFLAVIAGLLALALITIGMPYFNNTVRVEVAFSWAPAIVAPLAGMALFVGILAGLYPATVLSRAHPTTAFRGGSESTKGSKRLRETLVVFQFTVGIALVIASIVMVRQVGFMQKAPLSIAPDQVIELDVHHRPGHPVPERELMDRLEREPAILHIERARITPGGRSVSYTAYTHPEDPDSTNVMVLTLSMGPSAPAFMGLELIAGTFPESGEPSPFEQVYTLGTSVSSEQTFKLDAPYRPDILLNETAIRERGWTPDEAIGRDFPAENSPSLLGVVTGVVRDFHYTSLKRPIESVMIQPLSEESQGGLLLIGFAEGQDQAAMDAIRTVWDDVVPDLPMSAEFLADRYHNFYGPERRLAGLFWAFGIIAVIIACLGLFGLAAFTAERRVKEVGIRKVLGADTTSIVKLLSRDFAVLVVIAFVIAAPIAWWAMSRWLDDFAYHITLGPGIFLLAGFGALLVALATVSYHAFRAANTDPVRSLRSE